MSLLDPTRALALWVAVTALLLVAFLLRQRAMRVVVPSLAPYLGHIRRRASPLWRELLALLLQALAAGLVCVALIRPEDVEGPSGPPPWVAVVDASASMGQAGRMSAAAELIQALQAGVVLAGESPRWLADPSEPSQLERALPQLRAGLGAADLDAAITLVTQAGFRPLVLSDHTSADPEGGRWWVVGPGGPDLALLSLRSVVGAGLPPERVVAATVLLQGEARETTLRMSSPAGILGEERLSLSPGVPLTRTWRLPAGDEGWLKAELLDAQDSLPDNDQNFTALTPLRDAQVVVVGPGNRYLEQALALLPGVVSRTQACGAWRPRPVDLVIFDRCTGDPGGSAALWVDPPPGAGPFPAKERVTAPRFTGWDRAHPILRGVALRELNVAEASILSLPRSAEVLASVDGGPVFVASSETRKAALGFDLTRSDLPLSIAFPQLVYQLVLWGRAQDLAPAAPSLSISAGLELPPGASLQRLDEDQALIAPQEGLKLVLPPAPWAVNGSPLSLAWPEEELGSAESGAPWPEEPQPEAPVTPDRRITALALAAALLLLLEYGVAPR